MPPATATASGSQSACRYDDNRADLRAQIRATVFGLSVFSLPRGCLSM